MKKTLLIGYGNLDREDDGVAWHILLHTARRLDIPFPDDPTEELDLLQGNPALYFSLQLTPEFAEEISRYERVCFIDAHTGNYPQDLNIQKLAPEFQRSPFTHHLTPQSCLSLAQTLYGRAPEAILVSVKGYSFNFTQTLSQYTEELMPQAVKAIMDWLGSE
ncbi:MAG: hypothetical protein AAGU05_11085 [Anaerolineaceae bacterium]